MPGLTHWHGKAAGEPVIDPCVLCLVNLPTLYWSCSKSCQKRVNYLAELADGSFKKEARESAGRCTPDNDD